VPASDDGLRRVERTRVAGAPTGLGAVAERPQVGQAGRVSSRISRRSALGVLALVGAGSVGLVEVVRNGGPAPKAEVARGTTRLVESYGTLAGEWWVPPQAVAPGVVSSLLPTVVLLHGGYWQPGYDRHLEDAVAADLAARGQLVWVPDYAASDAPWPATLRDAATAFDWVVRGRYADRVDRGRVAVVGHSAGGQLALWLASRARSRAVGPAYAVRPSVVVAQAPVADLVAAASEHLGGDAVQQLLGGAPSQVPSRYREADPVQQLPTGVRTICLHSDTDGIVPISQSEAYVRAATAAGDPAALIRVPGKHFAHLDPSSQACAQLRRALGLP